MAGRPFAVVGPSGAGKDTLMQAAAAARPGLVLARRVITRPEAAGGEEFEGVTPEEFARRRDAGAFALHWQAHGLSYAIPASVHAALAAGRDVLFNLSRGVLEQAAAVLPGIAIVHVTAAPEVLAARLAGRGRESAADIAARLARPAPPFPPGLPVHEIRNDGAIEPACAALLAALDAGRTER